MPARADVPLLSDPAQFRAAIGPYLQFPIDLADAIEALQASDWFSVQSSATDATAGLLLKFGAFGLGSTAPKATDSDLDAIVGGGFWYADSTVANKPASGNYLVLHMGQTDTVATQMAISRSSGSEGVTYTRANVSGTWSAWGKVLSEDASGNVGIGTGTPTEMLDVNGDAIRIRSSQTPASATATGTTGTICWDANYIYTCVATNTWKRTALATW